MPSDRTGVTRYVDLALTMMCAMGAVYAKEFGFGFAIIAYGVHNFSTFAATPTETPDAG
jgi:hypothetical protein